MGTTACKYQSIGDAVYPDQSIYMTTAAVAVKLGLQMHIDITTPDAGIENALRKSAETGLLIHISELDISMNTKRTKTFVPTADELERQFQKYKFVVAAYKRLVPTKQQFGITMWNVGDADSWIPGFCNCSDFPSLFDKTYIKKRAYQGFLDGFK